MYFINKYHCNTNEISCLLVLGALSPPAVFHLGESREVTRESHAKGVASARGALSRALSLWFTYMALLCARNRDKLELLNKRILRFIFNDANSSYDELLKKAKTTSLYSRRNHKVLIVVFKSLFVSAYPNYLKKVFSLHSSKYFLRGNNVLSLPEPRTTTYRLESIKYEAAKLWNSLKDDMRQIISIDAFKNSLRNLNFHEKLL